MAVADKLNGNGDMNQLWVHLSGLADGNIFAIYPRILEEIFRQEEQLREEDQHLNLETLVLPSDMEFRLKIYFRLVEKQKKLDDPDAEAEVSALDKLKAARRWSRADSNTDPWAALIQPDGGRPSALSGLRAGVSPAPGPASGGPHWGPRELAKAARLLERPALPVTFDDDHEMRRVYSLIYDVFRYKGILEEALVEVGFYGACFEASNHKNIAWLLLLDQQRRRWAKRDSTRNSYLAFQRSEDAFNNQRKVSTSSAISNSSSGTTGDPVPFYKSSRNSSIDFRDTLFHRNIINTKVRAVRELSMDAISKARRKSSLEITSIPEAILPEEDQNNTNNKVDANVGTFEMRRLSKDYLDKIKINSEQAEKKAALIGRGAVKSGDVFLKALEKTRNELMPDSSTLLDNSSAALTGDLSRGDIQKIMVDAAGELGNILKKFDISLWDHQVKISAAIAKLRIRKKARSLSELLPKHLRDERMSATLERETITGWVNVFKSRNISDLLQRLNEMGFSYSSTRLLDINQFHLDTHCPKFISLRPPRRSPFVSSSLVTDSIIVLQEREFCLGAAALCRALRAAHLRGDVVQTHSTSPRAAAYLASQLQDHGPESGGLLVFGAGERKSEYEGVLRSLGVTNTRVFAEGASEVGGSVWAGAVAALAPPPNSYSAVLDPIDLVCSRGGDLGMLEVLTESEISMEGKLRVMKILEEQKKILRLCMSKPQIQIIVYETHSVLGAENGEMVKRAVAEANRAVRELHALRKQRAREALPRAPKCAAKLHAQDDESADSSDSEVEDVDKILAHENGREKKIKTEGTAPDTVGDDAKSKKKSAKAKHGKGTKGEKRPNESEEKPSKAKKSAKEKESPQTQRDSLAKKFAKVAEIKGKLGKVLDDVMSKGDQTDRTTDSSNIDASSVSLAAPIDPDSEYADVKVPDCDLFFEISPSPLAGLTTQEKEGCYLAVLQRKEMIRLNAKYMIKMAEARGLFGGNTPAPRRPPPTRTKVAAEEKKQVTRKLSPSQIERIAAPTHAWTARVGGCRSPSSHDGEQSSSASDAGCAGCPACARHHAPPGPRARLWWRMAARAAAAARARPLRLRLPRHRDRDRVALSLNVSVPELDVESPLYRDANITRLIQGVANM